MNEKTLIWVAILLMPVAQALDIALTYFGLQISTLSLYVVEGNSFVKSLMPYPFALSFLKIGIGVVASVYLYRIHHYCLFSEGRQWRMTGFLIFLSAIYLALYPVILNTVYIVYFLIGGQYLNVALNSVMKFLVTFGLALLIFCFAIYRHTTHGEASHGTP